MAKLRPAPNNRTAYNDGFGLTQYSFTASPNEDGNMTNQGRRVYYPNVKFAPSYQMGLARDPAVDGFYSTARVWMHFQPVADATQGFYRFPLTQGADIHDQSAPTFEVDFTAGLNTVPLSAFTVVEHSTLTHVGIWARAVTPSTDFLGIDVSELPVGAPPYASTVTITSAQIFSDQPAFTFLNPFLSAIHWGTFVARELDDGTGNIRVMGQLVGIPTSVPGGSRQSDLTALVTFVIDPTGKTVIEPAASVIADVAFAPHQLAEGLNVPMNGEAPQSHLWCIGRYDPNYTTTYSDTSVTQGSHNASPVAIWVCDDLDAMTPWTRVSHVAASEQTNTANLVPTIAPDTPGAVIPRDVGLSFDPAWQRLTAVAADTDASQDPYQRRQDLS